MSTPTIAINDSAELKERIGRFQEVQRGIVREVRKVIVGQEEVIEQVMISLFVGGHCLITGLPGTAKTLLVRTLAQTLGLVFKRIQFTPDLMPSDITGTDIIEEEPGTGRRTWTFVPGPIFSNILLADEINRTPPKTQSALLEAMQELSCTVRGHQYKIEAPFFVLATQNPIEFEGTYPLPEAQQDRFLLKIRVDYPPEEAERAVLQAVHGGHPPDRLAPGTLRPIFNLSELQLAQAALTEVVVEPGVLNYVLKIIRATRSHESILIGASPRGSIYLLLAAKAHALLQGRGFVIPDDVVAMAVPVLGHRMTLTADAEIQGATVQEIIQSILDKTEVPR